VNSAVLTGLSEGTAIAPSVMLSSFFQLVNSDLKVGSAFVAVSNGPPWASSLPSCGMV